MVENVAQYKILERVGAGGMGEVFRARDTRLGRTVAVKVLPIDVAADPDRRARLMREARAAAALSHPNIATLYEAGEDQGHLFLAFEFVPGNPLRTVIGGRPLNLRTAIQIAIQIADALADAHAAGIVHRDIKPDNIAITPKGNAKVLDFGLAKWTAGGNLREQVVTTIATGADLVLGTVAYMSPEQALGHDVDERSDIFSLGVVMWEMLTGSMPFRGPTPTAIGLEIIQLDPPAPSSVNPAVPAAVDSIVAKALAKDRATRYQSAATLAADLRSIDAILAAQTGQREKAMAPSRPASMTRGIVARRIALVASIAILGLATWVWRAPLLKIWGRTVSAPPPIVAVMPLELAESGASDRYFADGLTEDVIARLGQTAGIKVLGRSATRDYRGRSPRDLARELGAGVVLTGTLRRSGDAVKISLELIDPSDSSVVWTGQYTPDLKDIFGVQAQVAIDVARALRLKLRPTPAAVRVASRLVDRGAYDAYLRGRQAMAQRDLDNARQHFEQAIRLDDGLAEAHAGLAQALVYEPVYGASDTPERRARVKQAAARALEIDPDLPQVNLAAALAADRVVDGIQLLKKAIAADETFSEAFHVIGDLILDFDPQRAIEFYRHALTLDPRMEINRADIVAALSALGRFDEAEHELASIDVRRPLMVPVPIRLALDRKQYDEVLRILRDRHLAKSTPALALIQITILRMIGQRGEALRLARQLVDSYPDYCEARATLAALHHEQGQTAAAMQFVAAVRRQLETADIGAATLRCGVLAAAAVGDAAGTATLLRRIASDDRLQRLWSRQRFITTGGDLLRRRTYPLTRVENDADYLYARATLDRAYASTRQQLRELLPIDISARH